MSETTAAAARGDDAEARLVAALWRVVARHGWDGLAMRRVAAASGVPMHELRRRCPDRLGLLRLHGRAVDAAVLEGTVPGQGGTARDRVFDVLMRRIDALQPHRAGVLRLMRDLQADPLLTVLLLAELLRSMAWMLEAAELDTSGVAGLARRKGRTAEWLARLRAWARDGSEDLGPTMAALDRGRDRAEPVARSLRLDRGD